MRVLWIQVRPSVCLSVRSFSQNPLQGFFWFFAWSYGPINAKNWKARFFPKNPILAQMPHNGSKTFFCQIWTKMSLYWDFADLVIFHKSRLKFNLYGTYFRNFDQTLRQRRKLFWFRKKHLVQFKELFNMSQTCKNDPRPVAFRVSL